MTQTSWHSVPSCTGNYILREKRDRKIGEKNAMLYVFNIVILNVYNLTLFLTDGERDSDIHLSSCSSEVPELGF